MCLSSGGWSNPFLACTANPCPTLTAPTNGRGRVRREWIHTYIHTYIHTLTHSLTHSLTLTHTHTHSLTLAQTNIQECIDNDETLCRDYARDGECVTFYTEMSENCRGACGFCSTDDGIEYRVTLQIVLWLEDYLLRMHSPLECPYAIHTAALLLWLDRLLWWIWRMQSLGTRAVCRESWLDAHALSTIVWTVPPARSLPPSHIRVAFNAYSNFNPVLFC